MQNTLLDGLSKEGLDVSIKRQTRDKHLVDSSPNQLAALGTKARLAKTAGLLAKLPTNERTSWALEVKAEANVFYAEGKYQLAMETYLEALTASDFGEGYLRATNAPPEVFVGNKSKDSRSKFHDIDVEIVVEGESASSGDHQGNVEALIMPILCNLSACCIQLKQWSKALEFANQAVALRPLWPKAHFRKGIALLQMDENKDALKSLREAEKSSNLQLPKSLDTDSASDDTKKVSPNGKLNANDLGRLRTLMIKAKNGLSKDRYKKELLKTSMQKVFGSADSSLKRDQTEVLSMSTLQPVATPSILSPLEFVVFLVYYLWNYLLYFLFRGGKG